MEVGAEWKHLRKALFIPCRDEKSTPSCPFQLYIMFIGAQKQEKKRNELSSEFLEGKSIRAIRLLWLLPTKQELWGARAGARGEGIPGHRSRH